MHFATTQSVSQPPAAKHPSGPELVFANWREVLHRSGLPVQTQRVREDVVGKYLDYCVLNGMSVTKESARGFRDDARRRGLAPADESWEEAIRWFFRKGKERCSPHPEGVPSLGHADLGSTDWEQRMIERLRLQHYSWRTEQTYRQWARRFARFVGSSDLLSASGEHIRAFLTELAVKERISVATQKQALNSLVFLFREALGRDPGDLKDSRMMAWPGCKAHTRFVSTAATAFRPRR